MLRRYWLAALLLWAAVAQAGSVDTLKSVLKSSPQFRAQFVQMVYDRNSRLVQQSSGWFALARPGKFRWVVEQPFAQLMVGDGRKVWMYDPELKQVTVRAMDAALGSSPAALLTGDGTLEKQFALQEGGSRDNLQWVTAIPKAPDAGFAKLEIGLQGKQIAAMRLYDNFGQITWLTFSAVTTPATQDAALFRFVPPAGADVIGE